MSYSELQLNEIQEVSELEKRLLLEEIKALKPIAEGEFAINTLYIYEMEDKLEVRFIVRNATSKGIFFNAIPLSIMTETEKQLGYQVVDLKYVGELPPYSVTPITTLFSKSNFNIEGEDLSKCRLADYKERKMISNQANKAVLDYMDDSIDEVNKRILEKYIEDFPPINKNAVVIKTPKLIIQDEKASVPLIVFSGGDEHFNLEGIVVTLKNHLNIVKATKTIDRLPRDIEAHKANVYNVVFSDKDIFGEVKDLKTCRIEINT